MLEVVRKNARFFFAASLAALALRLLFVLRVPAVVDDSRLYADIALNWLQHGIYGITDSGQIAPTLSRLPGYPAFLAAVFAIFGWSNFRTVLLIQVLLDVGTCFLLADVARRMFDAAVDADPSGESPRAWRGKFLLSVGQFEDAGRDFRTMSESVPTSGYAVGSFGEWLILDGDYARATAVRAAGLFAAVW